MFFLEQINELIKLRMKQTFSAAASKRSIANVSFFATSIPFKKYQYFILRQYFYAHVVTGAVRQSSNTWLI